MKTLILAGMLNLSVDCSSLKNAEIHDGDQWKLEVCKSLVLEYENVVLTPISSSYKKLGIEANEIKNITSTPPLAGRLKVTRVVRIDEIPQEVTTNYSLQAYKNVFVFKRKMRAGELIGKSDFIEKKVNVGPFVGLRNFDVLNPEGMATNRVVAKGALVYEEILSVPPIIKVDDVLTIVLHADNLKIKTMGVALENGRHLQDEIKVRVVDTGAVVSGKITGKKDVYVEI